MAIEGIARIRRRCESGDFLLIIDYMHLPPRNPGQHTEEKQRNRIHVEILSNHANNWLNVLEKFDYKLRGGNIILLQLCCRMTCNGHVS